MNQDQWDHLELLEKGVLDTQDLGAHQVHLEPPATLKLANLVPQVLLENPEPPGNLVKEAQPVHPDQWDQEEHLAHLEPPDLLDFQLLENLDQQGFQAQWVTEESPA